MHTHIVDNYKGILHIVIFFIAMFKMHAIGRKLNLLEKRFVNK